MPQCIIIIIIIITTIVVIIIIIRYNEVLNVMCIC